MSKDTPQPLDLKTSYPKIYGVNIDWTIRSHSTDLSLVMNSSDCRFIGTLEECNGFIKKYQPADNYDEMYAEEAADDAQHLKICKWLTEQSRGMKIGEKYPYTDVADLIFNYIKASPPDAGKEQEAVDQQHFWNVIESFYHDIFHENTTYKQVIELRAELQYEYLITKKKKP